MLWSFETRDFSLSAVFCLQTTTNNNMNTLEEPSKTACEDLIENNLQLRYRVEELEKKVELLKFMSKELIECSEPSKDPLKETRYICTSTFMTAEINKE